jgi:catechol 2,3-dioxygenase-like lactoylglutathione lyase family enzyme
LKIVPVIKSSNLEKSVVFYTEILDFERKWPAHEAQETEPRYSFHAMLETVFSVLSTECL